MRVRVSFLILAVFALFLFSPHTVDSSYLPTLQQAKNLNQLHRVLVNDGTPVHDVGELHLHMTNWGMFGSMPGTTAPFAHAPSAEWPAGSGVEHLYSGGIWVGALKDGSAEVSTSTFINEFRPTEDPVDVVYYSQEGAQGGNRFPFPLSDDDGDGLYDEDKLDGRDNDGDGLIDEDFAAISNQMMSRWYVDNDPIISDQHPAHDPLDIMIHEESYQWMDDDYDDFVGIEYRITNIGTSILENIYVGIFADPDVGRRDTPLYFEDDACGFHSNGFMCTPDGADRFEVAYGYDADGDGGDAPGYIGFMFLGHPTDPTGQYAPRKVGPTTYASFSGQQSYEDGGDPTNDFERYELMASRSIERNSPVPRDCRILISTGPFKELPPGETLVIRVAVVMGEKYLGLLRNAVHAQLAFNGKWFDIDNDPATGVAGRETPIDGPADNIVIDPCDPAHDDPISIGRERVWINADCQEEQFRAEACKYGARDTLIYMTGVGGMETNVHWTLESRIPVVKKIAYPDIHPGSYPNSFNIKLFDFVHGDNPKKGGVLPVAILGHEVFDVHDIDISTVRLAGAAALPHGMGYDDVGAPIRAFSCPYTTNEPDGITDLTLKFRSQEVAAGISVNGHAPPGDGAQLTLTGMMKDGTPFTGYDCVRFVGQPWDPPGQDEKSEKVLKLRQPYPNPFNPVTRIAYYLPESGLVRLAVFDVKGRLVQKLFDGYQSAGEQSIEWDGSDLASGLYFYRLEAAGKVTIKRAVLVK